jgi:hypothetical protein
MPAVKHVFDFQCMSDAPDLTGTGVLSHRRLINLSEG